MKATWENVQTLIEDVVMASWKQEIPERYEYIVSLWNDGTCSSECKGKGSRGWNEFVIYSEEYSSSTPDLTDPPNEDGSLSEANLDELDDFATDAIGCIDWEKLEKEFNIWKSQLLKRRKNGKI